MLEAALWGLVAGAALLIGAGIGLRFKPPQWVIALVMAFGVGALISAVTYELTAEAYTRGGTDAVLVGLTLGALAFFAGDLLIDRRGGKHRKRSGGQQSESGGAILLGAVLDGIPESIVIGISLLEGGSVGLAFVAAVFISNLPEGLSGATGMRKAGHSPRAILTMWAVVCVASAVAAAVGYAVADDLLGERRRRRAGVRRRRHPHDAGRHDDAGGVRRGRPPAVGRPGHRARLCARLAAGLAGRAAWGRPYSSPVDEPPLPLEGADARRVLHHLDGAAVGRRRRRAGRSSGCAGTCRPSRSRTRRRPCRRRGRRRRSPAPCARSPADGSSAPCARSRPVSAGRCARPRCRSAPRRSRRRS